MKTILIADDSLFMRTWLKRIIHEANHKVVAEASNGQEAIELYNQINPDITFLDVTMPKVNGITALKEIIKINPKAKVIMCSALGAKQTVMEALQIGAKDFIVKPNFDKLPEILTKINE